MSGHRTGGPDAGDRAAGPGAVEPAPSTAQRATAVCALITASRRGRAPTPGANAALARIHGVYGARTRAMAAALVSASRTVSDRVVAGVVASARGPGGRALAGVHGSWLPGPGDAGEASARRWLARRVVATLVAMPAPAPTLDPRCAPAAVTPADLTPADLPRYPAARIEAALARIGAEIARAPRDPAILGGLDERGDPLARVRLGARVIASHVRTAGGDLAAQIAQRLPRPLGRIVHRELTSCPAGDRDPDPAVLALLAPFLAS